MNLRPVAGVLVMWVLLLGVVRVGGFEVVGEGTVIFRGEFRMRALQGWEVRADGWGRRWRGEVSEERARLFGGDEGWAGRFGRRVVLGLTEGGEGAVAEMAAEYGLRVERELGGGLWVLGADSLGRALGAAGAMAKRGGVEVSYPVVGWWGDVSWEYAARPEDGLYYAQWYLEGRDELGYAVKPDLNVRGAWPLGDGSGVVVAVADLGMELGHMELAGAVAGRPHYDFGRGVESGGLPEGLADGLSFYWAHGTEVAGLVGAELGRGRMVGVAPGVGLASWVIFEPDAAWLPVLVDDVALGQMFAYAGGEVGVQNHSWNRKGLGLHGMSPAELDGVYEAIVNGRGGRGVVLLRSAGNERLQGCNVNDDQYANLPLVVAVAGVYDDGRVLEESEPGACILVGAPAAFRTSGNPSGLVTTDLVGLRGVNSVSFFPPDEDLSDYVFNSMGFKGTSAAAPLVSGVAALVLSVAPELGVRDVQQILALSARHFDVLDPDLVENAAGFRVSHNVGFGVPDAGQAVRLASGWTNRPVAAELRVTATGLVSVPDDGLRVEVSGVGVPADWAPISGLPGTGMHPDAPTSWLSLRSLGAVAGPVAEDLTGVGALVLRGGGAKGVMVDQLEWVAAAGAEYAIVMNYLEGEGDTNSAPGGDALTPLGGTDFIPMPVMFIGNSDGERLRALVETNAAARVRMRLDAAEMRFPVVASMVCEQVGIRLKTDHPLRGDLRVTLLSPGGTRSVLQRFNGDLTAGPDDWTYWSTHHLGESSRGEWVLSVGDEYVGAEGAILEATLLVRGVVVTDTDADGLADDWEQRWLGGLFYGAKDDPDGDGYTNAFEQLAGQDPSVIDFDFDLDLTALSEGKMRLSWPGLPGVVYQVWGGEDLDELNLVAEVEGGVPETEVVVPFVAGGGWFYQVRY